MKIWGGGGGALAPQAGPVPRIGLPKPVPILIAHLLLNIKKIT
jgi:hypothetical protein